MKAFTVALAAAWVSMGVVGCGSPEVFHMNSDSATATGAGGAQRTGGAPGSGGAISGSGGRAASGGAPGSGGAAPASGGAPGSGGAVVATGGRAGTGGASGGTCIETIKAAGYSAGGKACSACMDHGTSLETKCKSMIDCLSPTYPTCTINSNCFNDCLNKFGDSVLGTCVMAIVDGC